LGKRAEIVQVERAVLRFSAEPILQVDSWEGGSGEEERDRKFADLMLCGFALLPYYIPSSSIAI